MLTQQPEACRHEEGVGVSAGHDKGAPWHLLSLAGSFVGWKPHKALLHFREALATHSRAP